MTRWMMHVRHCWCSGSIVRSGRSGFARSGRGRRRRWCQVRELYHGVFVGMNVHYDTISTDAIVKTTHFKEHTVIIYNETILIQEACKPLQCDNRTEWRSNTIMTYLLVKQLFLKSMDFEKNTRKEEEATFLSIQELVLTPLLDHFSSWKCEPVDRFISREKMMDCYRHASFHRRDM